MSRWPMSRIGRPRCLRSKAPIASGVNSDRHGSPRSADACPTRSAYVSPAASRQPAGSM
jgi:hypothetical protein